MLGATVGFPAGEVEADCSSIPGVLRHIPTWLSRQSGASDGCETIWFLTEQVTARERKLISKSHFSIKKQLRFSEKLRPSDRDHRR